MTFQSVAPIRNAAGQVCGVVLVARDVTERLRAVEALRTTMRRLEQQSAALADRRATRRCSAAISRRCCERLPKWRPGRWR